MGFARWWDQTIVPRIIKCGCSVEPIMELRARVVPEARGDVFELGCGGGINQRFFDMARITSFTGVDPSPQLRESANETVVRKGWPGTIPVDIRHGYGENIPFPDESFDTVVTTFTLCSVNDQRRVLAELRRILRPGGTLLYLEHGLSPDAGIAKWQRRIDPVWSKVFGNCHLSRTVHAAIGDAGFAVEPGGARYNPEGPKIAGWMEWGRARKAG